MNRKTLRILYLEDSPLDVELVRELLAREYFACELTWVNSREAYLSALRDGWNYDLLLVDFSLPDIGGEEALELARERLPHIPFIYLSGSLGEERAVECLRQGATDYVLKTNLSRLAPVARRALIEAGQATARRAAEASHGRVAALLRATLEATSEGILVVDLAGRISAYNRKFLSLMGIPEYVMAPMEMDGVIQYLTDQVGDPATLLDEARLLRSRSDKETHGILPLVGDRILEKSGRPHKVGGEMVGRVLSFREPQPREAAGTLLKAIGNTRQGYSEAALATRVVPWHLVEDRLVIPEHGAAILGVSPPPSDLRALVDLLHPEDAQFLMEALEQGQNVSFKARVRQADGSWRWLRWNLDRGPEGYRGVFMDITEQVWLQERAFQRKRAEGARDLSRRLAGKLQDKLRNTLTTLLGRDPGLAEALQPLQDIDRLLARMRTFAQLGRPVRAFVHPNAFVEDLLPRARSEAGPGLQIQFRPGADLPDLQLDPVQMEVALLELLRNAWQASPSGTLQVVTGLRGPRTPRPGGLPGRPRPRVFFEVRDPGPGIPPGLHRQIFEPFFTARTEPCGAGLGLAMVQEIAEGHEGSVQVESAPGKGTAVRILLPV